MSQSFKEYTDEIENVKFGMGKSKINKGIKKLTSILDKIDDPIEINGNNSNERNLPEEPPHPTLHQAPYPVKWVTLT